MSKLDNYINIILKFIGKFLGTISVLMCLAYSLVLIGAFIKFLWFTDSLSEITEQDILQLGAMTVGIIGFSGIFTTINFLLYTGIFTQKEEEKKSNSL